MSADVRVVCDSSVCVAELTGEVDLATARRLGDEILSRVSTETLGVVLDLTGVNYFDSTGVSLLFDLDEALRSRRQRLAIVIPKTSKLVRLFEITALDSVISVSNTIEAAQLAASAD